MTYFPSNNRQNLQQFVVCAAISLMTLSPNIGLCENIVLAQHRTLVLSDNYMAKGIINLDEYTFDVTPYNQITLSSSIEVDKHNRATDKKQKNSNIYRQLINKQPQLEKWIDPWIDAGDGPPKNIAVNWNQKQPGEMSIKARPFHSIDIIPSELKKIVINKRLVGSANDLSACYNINSDTTAEIAQKGNTAIFLVNYSGKF
ncbi:MAG: hypothetical protein HQL71_02250 [Magnetococcales bacterium]|nr:hypothetical protein [Magnetococcales bacterium]